MELLLLGYEGILGKRKQSNDEEIRGILIKDNGNEDVAKEHGIGVQSYIDNKTITDEKAEELLNNSDENLSLDDLAVMFGGEVVKVDDN